MPKAELQRRFFPQALWESAADSQRHLQTARRHLLKGQSGLEVLYFGRKCCCGLRGHYYV